MLVVVAGCGASRGNGNGNGNGDGGTGESCPAGSATTLVGTVFAPNGLDPVPNATVYVPQGGPIPFSESVACDLARMGISQLDLYNDRDPGSTLPATVGELDALLNDRVKLKKYNILMINCTKAQFEASLAKPAVLANLEDYVHSGGRLYAT